jgi:sugar phosphate isomerase/epimerase
VKIAVTSGAFDDALERGDLTQLEFLDAAARLIGCDGVVLDVRHFPRTDSDYLAQVKKMAADLGLTIAALASDAFFSADEAAMRATLEYALAVGAPLLAGRLAPETASAWSTQLTQLSLASGLAKAVNVTLALRNAPGTYAATVHDCKRVTKETDSAWLRYGLDLAAFGTEGDLEALRAKTVLLWQSGGEETAPAWEGFRGFVVLEKAKLDRS